MHRGIIPKLTVTLLPRQDLKKILDEQDRWDLLRRCFVDESMPLDTRAIAAMVLLFGLHVSRIRHLTVGQLDIGANRSFINGRPSPITAATQARRLLKRLADTPHTRARLATGEYAPRWLFPGLTSGQPISQSSVRVKLQPLGIDARAARNAALISLAENLPMAVLADVLGPPVGTAERWAALAKRDCAAYIAERAGDLQK